MQRKYFSVLRAKSKLNIDSKYCESDKRQNYWVFPSFRRSSCVHQRESRLHVKQMAVWWWTTWSLLLVQGVKGKGTVDTEWRVLFLILLQILSFSFSLPSLTALMPLVPLIAMEGQSFAM